MKGKEMGKLAIEITFTEPLLATMAGDKELAENFIASKHPDGIQTDEAEAIDNIDESLEKASTVFPREDGVPFLWDYQIKGFFKEACIAMIETDTITQKELKSLRLTQYMHKRTIDNQIFVAPRKIILDLPGEIIWCERPLRGMTMRGERISLARSEEAPIGTKFVCEIILMNKKLVDVVKRWLDYGALKGIGQWRNSGKGRFDWRLLS